MYSGPACVCVLCLCVCVEGCAQRTEATIARVIVVHIWLKVVIRILDHLNELDQRLGQGGEH